MAETIPVCMMPSQSNSMKFSWVKSGTQGVCGLLSELKSTAPIRIATTVVPRIPNRIAPRTCSTIRMAISSRPIITSWTLVFSRLPI
ncbi:hypothetical protein D3C73_1356110 [compost metagenome]